MLVAVPYELRVDARRTIEREIVVVKVRQGVAAIGVAGKTARGVIA